MPKNMQQTKSTESMNYLWVLIILVLIAGVFAYNSKKQYRMNRTYITPQETTIMNANDLEKESMELENTDIDMKLENELDLLEKDAADM